MMNRIDWNLLAIGAASGQPLSPVQLQKSLFLFEQAYPEEFLDRRYSFTPYDYGPFSAAVYSDAEQLAGMGLVFIGRTGAGWSTYAATPDGLKRAAELAEKAPPAPVAYMRNVVEWARSLSFQQLVRAIYDRYPAYRENSVFRY